MKVIIMPIFWFCVNVVAVVVGIIYSILFLIWNPKGLIKEKKKEIIYRDYKIDYWATLKSRDFWCPYFDS